MLGKMAKYFFILSMLGVVVQIAFLGPPREEMRVMLFSFFCFMFSFMSFVGWILNQPLVVRIDKSDQ